jgi:lauroyl/myristoyl acyltransferase
MTQDQDTNHSRFGVFGDFPTRAMTWLIDATPRMPYIIEASLLWFFAFVVFVLARQQRESIRSNLKAIYDDLSFAEGYVGAFMVFRNFGWSYIDSIRTRLGQDVVTWELDGEDVFEKVRGKQGAAMLFTTHTGNYDLAGALFANHFERVLHTVRAPERSAHLKNIREQKLSEDMDNCSCFKVHFNSEDNLLGIELARLLSEGELLAIQGDRVIGDVAQLDVPVANRNVLFRIPKGPMSLACFARCPCYPLFVVRDRYRHYRVIFEPALVPLIDLNKRKPDEMDYAKPWVDCLYAFLKKYGQQWFVFEDAFISPVAKKK